MGEVQHLSESLPWPAGHVLTHLPCQLLLSKLYINIHTHIHKSHNYVINYNISVLMFRHSQHFKVRLRLRSSLILLFRHNMFCSLLNKISLCCVIPTTTTIVIKCITTFIIKIASVAVSLNSNIFLGECCKLTYCHGFSLSSGPLVLSAPIRSPDLGLWTCSIGFKDYCWKLLKQSLNGL